MKRKSKSNPTAIPNEFQELMLTASDDEPYQILHILKNWMENNDKFKRVDFEHDYPCLWLLLRNKPTDFVIRNSPGQGIYLKSNILRATQGQTEPDLLFMLNHALSIAAIPTEWEDCPVCCEGYLEYWVEPQQKPRKVFLYCPECSHEEFLNGWEDAAEPHAIFPALRRDHNWIAPITLRKKGRLLDWNKPLPKSKGR